MQTLPKCFLLPIDGTDESLRPAGFLSRLYRPEELRIILCHFSTPAPPAYSGAVAPSNELQIQKRQFFEKLKQEEQRILSHALETLLKEGFSKEFIQEHVEPKQSGVARQACLLGDMRKVDAIVVPKQVTSSLEDLMKTKTSSVLAQQCIECPVWVTQGQIDTKKAAIYIMDEETSMRIADHAAFMLSDTDASMDLVGFAAKTSHPISCRPSEAPRLLMACAAPRQLSSLLRASSILTDNGVAENRIRITLLPKRNDTVSGLLSWCASNGIGIIGLARPPAQGIIRFLKTSATGEIISALKNMAVWIA